MSRLATRLDQDRETLDPTAAALAAETNELSVEAYCYPQACDARVEDFDRARLAAVEQLGHCGYVFTSLCCGSPIAVIPYVLHVGRERQLRTVNICDRCGVKPDRTTEGHQQHG